MSTIMFIILFLGAMLYIGIKTEQTEQTPHSSAPTVTMQPATPPKQPDHPSLPPTNALYLQTENARQAMQLAWDKIPADIQKELEKEQNQWIKQTKQTCQQKSSCLIQAYQKRADYLQGYSIH